MQNVDSLAYRKFFQLRRSAFDGNLVHNDF